MSSQLSTFSADDQSVMTAESEPRETTFLKHLHFEPVYVQHHQKCSLCVDERCKRSRKCQNLKKVSVVWTSVDAFIGAHFQVAH